MGCPVLQHCSWCGPQRCAPAAHPPAAAPGQDAAMHGDGVGEAPSASPAEHPSMPPVPSLGPHRARPPMSPGGSNTSRPA